MLNNEKKILKRCVSYLALFLIGLTVKAQENYFQQEVNYNIDVKLDDVKHTLTAKETIQYINNSKSGLSFIYFHLWPNAYKNTGTALAQQMLEHKNTSLYFSDPAERGFIDSLDFYVDGVKANWEYDAKHIDICRVILPKELAPGDTITISTPFYVKIPDARFSRLGHTEQAYFMTQWYPKPAVFDKDGWHPMPYLDQGEFYSEFGSFDVRITLPQNYLLAATGDRIDAKEEEQFIASKISETKTFLQRDTFGFMLMRFPPSSEKWKTVRFVQQRVHDFAWFADKRFLVLKGEVEMPLSKKKVDTWIYFTGKNSSLWKNALDYVNDATLFYSALVGDYPYNHVTAVDGTIMAGGGMEYPNITVIGDAGDAMSLDLVITHEVGHNWFYGILGSNERQFPFMDEGINSFYETRYMRGKYPDKKITQFIGRDSTFSFLGLNKTPYWKYHEVFYKTVLHAGFDQSLALPSEDYSSLNYGGIVYSKTPVVMDYLMQQVGEQNFDEAMRFYFDQYKFRHPDPSDLFRTLSHFSGKDLATFERELIYGSGKADYKLKKVKRGEDGSFTLTIKNKTGLELPFNVSAVRNNKTAGMIWLDGFRGRKEISFPPVDADMFVIDAQGKMPDVNRANNFSRTSGMFKKRRKLQLNFLGKFDDHTRLQVNYIPVIGANYYNGLMAGISLHNYGLYQKRFQYIVTPMYAFNTQNLTGTFDLAYNFYPRSVFRHGSLGIQGKSFAYDKFNNRLLNEANGRNDADLYFNFVKLEPYLNLELRNRDAGSQVVNTITYASANLFTDSLLSPSANSGRAGVKRSNYSFVNEFRFRHANRKAIHPYSFYVGSQHNSRMAKITASLGYQITVGPKHAFDLRLFGGAFVAGDEEVRSYYAFRSDGYNGYDDYTFDHHFLARNERSGFGFSQFAETDGAMKIWTPFQSTTWMVALNARSPKILILPLRLFADVVVDDQRSLWDAGVNLTIWKNIIEVYLPVFYSEEIKKVHELNNIGFLNRIRFTFNIHKLVPKNIIRNNIF